MVGQHEGDRDCRLKLPIRGLSLRLANLMGRAMKTVNVHEAKTALSQLLADVERGEDIVIARNGVPVARLTAIRPAIRREPGLWRGYPGWERYVFDPSILAPMADKELEDEGWV
jgi:prevent-host-death family protein